MTLEEWILGNCERDKRTNCLHRDIELEGWNFGLSRIKRAIRKTKESAKPTVKTFLRYINGELAECSRRMDQQRRDNQTPLRKIKWQRGVWWALYGARYSVRVLLDEDNQNEHITLDEVGA